MKSARTLSDADEIDDSDIFDLEAAYVDLVASMPRDPRQGVFHPSTVGMCGRRNVYEYISAPAKKALGVDKMEIFAAGHAFHTMVQSRVSMLSRVLEPRGIHIECYHESPCPDHDDLLLALGIAGHSDTVVRLWNDEGWEQRGIMEIKSINDAGYQKLRGPSESHLMQAHIYAYRFDCPLIWVWYVNKNNSRRHVFPSRFDHAVLDTALGRFQGWYDHAQAGTLPPREESWFACAECEYQTQCQPQVLHQIRAKQSSKALSVIRNRGLRRVVAPRRKP